MKDYNITLTEEEADFLWDLVHDYGVQTRCYLSTKKSNSMIDDILDKLEYEE